MGRPLSIINEVIDPTELLFKDLPQSFLVGRYHSWIVESKGLPEDLIVTAVDHQGGIMAIRHKVYNVRGVQFHPESILTENGPQILRNWLSS